MVRDYDFGETMEFEDMINKQLSVLFCSGFSLAGEKMHHFPKSVNEYGDCGNSLKLWQISDKVGRNLLPFVFW